MNRKLIIGIVLSLFILVGCCSYVLSNNFISIDEHNHANENKSSPINTTIEDNDVNMKNMNSKFNVVENKNGYSNDMSYQLSESQFSELDDKNGCSNDMSYQLSESQFSEVDDDLGTLPGGYDQLIYEVVFPPKEPDINVIPIEQENYTIIDC